jgi:hypothetical protein
LLPILGCNIAATAVEGNKVKSKININNLHRISGNCSKTATKVTRKVYRLNVVGDYKTCEACSVAKARQKYIHKDWKGGSVIAGSFIKVESYGGSKGATF